jgi:hypothetical protein
LNCFKKQSTFYFLTEVAATFLRSYQRKSSAALPSSETGVFVCLEYLNALTGFAEGSVQSYWQ